MLGIHTGDTCGLHTQENTQQPKRKFNVSYSFQYSPWLKACDLLQYKLENQSVVPASVACVNIQKYIEGKI